MSTIKIEMERKPNHISKWVKSCGMANHISKGVKSFNIYFSFYSWFLMIISIKFFFIIIGLLGLTVSYIYFRVIIW